VREQTVVADADAQAAGNPPKYNCQRETSPAKKETCSNRADVKAQHEQRRCPIDRLGKSPVVCEGTHDFH
jgi:hypothetical protein